MGASVHRLSGNDWQEWADQLLKRHYGPVEYQRVPAKDAGDAGIEGFSLNGHAYQAYGVEEPVTAKVRYEKQRDKMTIDIGKFTANGTKLTAMLGTVKISRWCLFVPFFDSKDLVVHASTKTHEVVAQSLPYVAPGFRVVIASEDDFAVERDALVAANVRALDVSSTDVTPANVQKWFDENDVLLAKLDAKIRKIPTLKTDEERGQFRDKVVKHFLEGQNILEELRRYPDRYEYVVKAKNGQEKHLATECMLATGKPNETLLNVLKTMRSVVSANAGLSEATTSVLGWEAVSDWLIRCPLDFPEP